MDKPEHSKINKNKQIEESAQILSKNKVAPQSDNLKNFINNFDSPSEVATKSLIDQRFNIKKKTFDPTQSSGALNASKLRGVKNSSFYRKGYNKVSKADTYRIFEVRTNIIAFMFNFFNIYESSY